MIEYYDFQTIQVSSYQQPKNGNVQCGDSYFVNQTDNQFICAIADGLGSGYVAKQSSEAAVSAVEAHCNEPVETIMEKANQSLKGMRGAVLTIFKINFQTKQIEFCGVGNVHLIIYTHEGKVIRPLSYSGYLSGQQQRYHVQNLQLPVPCSFIIYSDGLKVNSKSKEIVQMMHSARDASYHVQQLINSSNDDVTFLIGKIN
jgi:phosphoserine phosphatase RsbX